MRVWVLGAGASKSYSASPTRQRMPIARDFFKVFRQLKLYEHPWVLRGKLIHYLKTTGRNPERFLAGDVDIEELHSEIEAFYLKTAKAPESPLNKIEVLFAFGAYVELMFLFAAVVNAIQNGPISLAHVRIAERLAADDVLITFNWDALMDRALASTGRWKPDYGYGIQPKAIFRDGWVPPDPSPEERFPLLLKLHGSANWITSYPLHGAGGPTLTQTSSPDTVRVFEHATRPYATFAGRYMNGYGPYSFGYYPPNITDDPGLSAGPGKVFVRGHPGAFLMPEGSADDAGLVSMPLIIPPVKDKRYDLFGRLFGGIWKKAEDALTNADEIIVIGYSFPRTDHRSNKLFLDALSCRATMPRVIIIDPAPESIEAKFLLEFGIAQESLRVHKTYFSDATLEPGAALF